MADKKETALTDKVPKTTLKAEAPAAGGTEAEKALGNKKINKMTATEIDAKLNEIKSSQGGLRSKYAKDLFRRKKTL